jgi:hypothetical protein
VSITRNKHPSKTIELALQYAESKGWRYKESGNSSHAWGECFVHIWIGMVVKCRFGQRQVMRKRMPVKSGNILIVAPMKRDSMEMKQKYFEFTLVLDKVDDNTPNLEDSLYEAGCSDALINFRSGTVYLDFTRKAISFNEAILSAIKQIESSPLGAKVISIAPDNLVSESEIAERLNLKRQAVSLWVKGKRRNKEKFPNPVRKLSEASPLWRWHEIVAWSIKNKIIREKAIFDEAIFIENLNLVLEERMLPGQSMRKLLHAILA